MVDRRHRFRDRHGRVPFPAGYGIPRPLIKPFRQVFHRRNSRPCPSDIRTVMAGCPFRSSVRRLTRYPTATRPCARTRRSRCRVGHGSAREPAGCAGRPEWVGLGGSSRGRPGSPPAEARLDQAWPSSPAAALAAQQGPPSGTGRRQNSERGGRRSAGSGDDPPPAILLDGQTPSHGPPDVV